MRLVNFFRKGWLAVATIGATLALEGCFNESDVYNPSDYFEKDLEAIEAYIADNNLDVKLDTAYNFYYQVHNEGDGYRGVRGTRVLLHYQGKTLEGREFANNFNTTPEVVYLGIEDTEHQYNPTDYAWGLDSWLFSRRREGDSITVFIPSPYGFRNSGFSVVAPNTPIMYTVKFEDIVLLSEDIADIDQYISSKGWTSEIEENYGMRYVVHELGDPNLNIDNGDFISVYYEGRTLDDNVFDSNFDGSTLTYTLGGSDDRTIIGFRMGLELLNKGDSATFFIPSIYGYGANGNPPEIPANAPLRFTIKVANVTKY